MKPTLEQIKTDESVWPEGSEYYSPSDQEFHDDPPRSSPWSYIKRPTKTFVPEVGFHGECTYAGRTLECVVVLKNRVCVFDHGFEVITPITPDLDIRPIKSEREKFVENALKLDCEPHEGMLSRSDFVGAMYDAGCRFMENDK
jgi:hypothetical protein